MKRLVLLFSIVITACSTSGSSRFDTGNRPPPVVAPPVIACSSDGGVDDGGLPAVDMCQLPPSVCADSNWAAYFDNGTCVNGTCELTTKYHYCDQGCGGGACISQQSTLPSRGF